MTKKFVLYPADLAVNQPPLPPYQRQMNVLDSEMRNILDDRNLPAEEKVKMYYNTLRQYGLVEQNATNPDYIYRPPKILSPTPQQQQQPQAVQQQRPPPLVPVERQEQQLPVADGEILEQVPPPSRKNVKKKKKTSVGPLHPGAWLTQFNR